MFSFILRNLPLFKGKQRLARFLFRNRIEHGKDFYVRGKYDCTFKVPNIIENVGFEIFINGIYERDTIDFIVNRIKPGLIFLDIGANIGAICIPVSKRSAGLKVIGVEAAPWVFEYLEENVKSNNLSNITILNKAISSVSGQEVEFYSPRDKFGKGSLSPIFSSEGIKVETTTIDGLAGRIIQGEIGFIKIDIEGFEHSAFQGGTELLRQDSAPDILFEFVDWAENSASNLKAGDAQKLLIEYGYSIFVFENGIIGRKLSEPMRAGASMLFATKHDLPWKTMVAK